MKMIHVSYPRTRLRRLRYSQDLRDIFRESELRVEDLVYPVFVLDGVGRMEDIISMPGQSRMSVDVLLSRIPAYIDLGIKSLAIFPVIETKKTVDSVSECYNPDGLIQMAIRAIKSKYPQLIIFSDIALDPYTHTGHDGIVDNNNYVINDITNEFLVKQALSHAKAGSDFVCPSDMMDGRIGVIRDALEANGYHNTAIMAYSVKYASSFYGPFRDAVSADKNLGAFGKKSYQMNPANSDEALHETRLDLIEGADVIMVKPGIAYLDILYRVKSEFKKPTAVYQVSGEYAMLKSAAAAGFLDYETTLLETMVCFKRAGASIIWTYAALDIARLLKENK